MNQNDFESLTKVRLQYLPTPRSRKWRNASISMRWRGTNCINDVRWVAVPYK